MAMHDGVVLRMDQASSSPGDAYTVEGVRVNAFSLDAAVDKIERGITRQDGPFAVFTINLDHIVKLRSDRDFQNAYRSASIVLPDGFPIALLGRIAGLPVQRATGSDLIEPLCRRAAQKGLSVFLFGTTHDVLATAAAELQKRVPDLVIAGTFAPPQGFDTMGAGGLQAIERLKAAASDIYFLALGAPKQELLAARCLDHLDKGALVCVGAGLDFIAGSQIRAPVFVRKLYLEWLWRLMQNPRRLARRYLSSALVLPALLRKAFILLVMNRGQDETERR